MSSCRKERCVSGLSGPGVLDNNVVENMKSTEAPEFYEGRLVKHRPARHCIPRYKYYFSSDEWFENTEVTRKPRKSRSISHLDSNDNTKSEAETKIRFTLYVKF